MRNLLELEVRGPLVCREAGSGDPAEDVDFVRVEEIESYLGRIEIYRTKIDALRGR